MSAWTSAPLPNMNSIWPTSGSVSAAAIQKRQTSAR